MRNSVGDAVRPSLTYIESNAVRYMAGFVAVKLLKKFKKSTKSAELRTKNKLFIRILQNMKAIEQPGEPDSLTEYSSLWSELIDRGGLYHINDDVFHLMESIEMIVRLYFNIPDAKSSYTPGTDISKAIREKVLGNNSILQCWEKMTIYFPPPNMKHTV